MTDNAPVLTPEDIARINRALSKGASAEVKPTKDGVRVLCIYRQEVKD